jgi:hypothetical protein
MRKQVTRVRKQLVKAAREGGGSAIENPFGGLGGDQGLNVPGQ